MTSAAPPSTARRILTRLQVVFLPSRLSVAVLAGYAIFCVFFIARTAIAFKDTTYFCLFDDGMISMHYAQNLRAGHGLVWNAGQAPVEGYTNLLWTLWMAFLHFVPIHESKISLLVMLSGMGILLAHAWCCGRIAARLRPEDASIFPLTVLFCATFYPLTFWTLRGMEVGFLSLLLAQSALCVLDLGDLSAEETRRRRLVVGKLALLLSLGFLTRDDFAVPSLIVIAGAAIVSPPMLRRSVFCSLAGILATVIVVRLTFRMAYYGDWVPNTYHLKVDGFPLRERLLHGGKALAGTMLFNLGGLALVAGWNFFFGPLRRNRHKVEWLLLVLLIAQISYSVYVGGDAWEWMSYANRYLCVASMPLLMLVALALSDLGLPLRADRLTAMPRWAVVPLSASVFALMWRASSGRPKVDFFDRHLYWATLWPNNALLGMVILLLTLPWLQTRPGRNLASAWCVAMALCMIVASNGQAWTYWWRDNAASWHDESTFTRYGLVLREATPRNARLTVAAAGAITYFSHRRTVDLLGKCDPVIARMRPANLSYPPGHMKFNYDYSIKRLRPEILAQVFKPNSKITSQLKSWGYVPIWRDWVWVRRDIHSVDSGAIRHVLRDYYFWR